MSGGEGEGVFANDAFNRPSGTQRLFVLANPAINRRATINRPFGTVMRRWTANLLNLHMGVSTSIDNGSYRSCPT